MVGAVKVNYRLSIEAKADLNRIYLHWFEEFGERGADQYFRDFIERFEVLAEQPKMYPTANEVAEGLRKSLCGRDTIYYEIVEKLEEDYSELQYFHHYFKDFNSMLAENMIFDSTGNLVDILQL